MTRTLVTGAAGFIGFHLARRLLAEGHEVVGVDDLRPDDAQSIKEARLDLLRGHAAFSFHREDIADQSAMEHVFAAARPEVVFGMAAQAGVRRSLRAPHDTTRSNLEGFLNVLEGCRHQGVGHLVYASSSSVYGANASLPFSEREGTAHPMSLYAATKRANELMAHSYSHLYGLPTTGLRFFTVYGPWGRPDMALFKFAEAMVAGRPIQVFNHGEMERDFTYVADAVEAVVRLAGVPPSGDPDWDPRAPVPCTSTAPFRVLNVGNNAPVRLLDMIAALERALGVEATLELVEMQAGDVPATSADTTALSEITGFSPTTSLEEGIAAFVGWYRDYTGVGAAGR